MVLGLCIRCHSSVQNLVVQKKKNTQSIVIGQVIKTLKYLEFNLRETARTEVYVESC